MCAVVLRLPHGHVDAVNRVLNLLCCDFSRAVWWYADLEEARMRFW